MGGADVEGQECSGMRGRLGMNLRTSSGGGINGSL